MILLFDNLSAFDSKRIFINFLNIWRDLARKLVNLVMKIQYFRYIYIILFKMDFLEKMIWGWQYNNPFYNAIRSQSHCLFVVLLRNGLNNWAQIFRVNFPWCTNCFRLKKSEFGYSFTWKVFSFPLSNLLSKVHLLKNLM